jgi:hypothetical protein
VLWLPATATRGPGGPPALRPALLLDQTQGPGGMDPYHQADGSARKLPFVYPLSRVVQQRLRVARLPTSLMIV